jgi:hypothetical protein
MTSLPTDAVRNPVATAPAWSMLAVACGGIAALVLIPEHAINAPGALVPAAWAMAAGLLAGPAVAATRNLRAAFRCEHLLSFGLFYWLLLDIVLGQVRVNEVSYDAVVRTFTLILVFALALWGGSALAALPAQRLGAKAPAEPGTRFLYWAALAAGVLGLSRVLVGCSFSPACLVDAFYQPRFAPVWHRIDAFGHFDTVFLYSRYFGFLVLPLTVALVIGEGRITRRSVTTFLLGLLCLVFMIGDGGRKDVGTAVGAGVLVWALMKSRLGWRQVLPVAGVAAMLVVLMQFMLVARNVGVGKALSTGVALTSPAATVGTVDRNFRALSTIVQVVPERYPHNGWQGVAFAATLWIPGGLVPREWQQRTIPLPSLLRLSVGPGYSWTCSALGDLYLIGGLPVVMLGGLLFGMFARLTSRLLIGPPGSQRPILYALLTMTLFLSLRALHEVFVTGFIVLAFACFVFARRVLLARARPALGAPV